MAPSPVGVFIESGKPFESRKMSNRVVNGGTREIKIHPAKKAKTVRSERIKRCLVPWAAPAWVPKNIPCPKYRLKLASLPTPIERWFFPTFESAVPGVELYIKRDDQTGCSLTGNKIRKLEYLLCDAVNKGCDTIITCGAATSNHCRSTALACAKLGLDCHLLLSMVEQDINLDSGNVCLSLAAGAKLYQMMTSNDGSDEQKVNQKMKSLEKKLSTMGKKSYIIPRGGSNEVSIWGYVKCWAEMESQPEFESITDICVVSGSGGTGLDLALANYWTGSKKRIHGIRTWGDSGHFYKHANDTLIKAGIENIQSEDIINCIDGHVGKGYAVSWDSLREFCIKSCSESGIVLDRVYTGKAVYGLMNELKSNRKQFLGNKIMFVHTGGLYGFIDGSMDQDLISMNPVVRTIDF